MIGDAPSVAGDIATALRIDERKIRALRIRKKPDDTTSTITPVRDRIEPFAAAPRPDGNHRGPRRRRGLERPKHREMRESR
jgi:hypothetical protein